jgi:hypothetical protein
MRRHEMARLRFIRTILFVIFAIAFSNSCEFVSGSGGCGYQARFRKPDGVNSTEIRIQRIVAETVGGHTSCGYAYVWTKAAKMEIAGATVPERIGKERVPETYVNYSDQGGVDYFYEAAASFDPRKDLIRIETADGSRYTSRPETIKEHSANSMTIALK